MNYYASGAEKALSDDIPVRIFTYTDIYHATNNFSSIIGEGGFGTVYRATIHHKLVAVKKLKSAEGRDFITELKTLTRFKHENLLAIIGFCDDPNCPSLVLEYMTNGSLEDRLENKYEPLPWDVRVKIAYGAALGINHLHTSGVKPMVHRDIKSANILLNENFVPKVADFGLVREGDSGLSKIRPVTQNFCYTPFYKAPEARKGDVSIKLDTYSFGVVLLELLTGLKPCHEEKALRSYTEKDILGKLLDSGAEWDKSTAEKMYKISKRCLIKSKTTRPKISKILGDLRDCVTHIPVSLPSVLGGIQGDHEVIYYRPPLAVGDDASSTENSSYYASSTENSSYYASSTENSSYYASSTESSSYYASSGETDSSDDVSSDESTYAETQWKILQRLLNSSTEDRD